MKTQILIVDDQAIIRDGLFSILSSVPDFDLLPPAQNGRIAIECIDKQIPDLMLLDIRMPQFSGFDVLLALQEKNINLPTMLLTTFDDTLLVRQGMSAGARGYILKESGRERLISAIRLVLSGGVALDENIIEKMMISSLSNTHQDPIVITHQHDLTRREQQILELIAKGLTNREIACELQLSEGTVKNYVSVILNKLDATSRTLAVTTALQAGLL